MSSIDDFGSRYILLGLRMAKIIKDYLDSYFGPSELIQLVKDEIAFSPTQLLNICQELQRSLPDQGFKDSRKRFLEKMLKAMETSLELKKGKVIPYLDQVKRLYDITPEYRTDSELYKGVEKLDAFYEGSGTLLDRLKVIYKRRALPKRRILKFCRQGMKVVRDRTNELFPDLLPDGESENIKKVKRKTWVGYNWYLGNFKSRFDICTDRRVSWHTILDITAHEGYPGHHVESCVKDKLLYHEKNHFEQCIRLSFTPQMVLYEGLANLALNTLFTQYEQEKIAYETFCIDPSEEDLDNLVSEKYIWNSILGFTTNMAFHLYVDEWSEEEVLAFMLDLGFMPEAQIQSFLNLVKDPNWKTFHFNYITGERLIKRKYGENISPKDYTTLLKNSFLPSDLL